MFQVRSWALLTFLGLLTLVAEARRLDLKPHLKTQSASEVEKALIREEKPDALDICVLDAERYRVENADDEVICTREGGRIDHAPASDRSSMTRLTVRHDAKPMPQWHRDLEFDHIPR